MPLTDAMACGIPCMAVRYSAMEDHLKCPTSIPIEVGRYFYESIIETEQRRVLPNNDDFVQKLDNFVRMNDDKRNESSQKTRDYAVDLVEVYGQKDKLSRFSWDRTAAIWYNTLKDFPVKDQLLTWDNPIPQIYKPNIVAPNKYMNNTEFIKWSIINILNEPSLANSYFAIEWTKYLNGGFRVNGGQKIPVDRKHVVDSFTQMINHKNNMEIIRVNKLKQQQNTNNIDCLII